MKTLPLVKILSSLFLFVGLTAVAAPVAPKVVDLGNNTYSITYQSTNAFKRNVDTLKSEAQQEAAAYCSAQGKQLKVISLTSERPFFGTGYANAKIVFKALAAGDPGLTAVEPTEPGQPAMVMRQAPPPPPTTTDLYNDLTKLDDLRKKGILTDEEFQTEKRKILNRSN